MACGMAPMCHASTWCSHVEQHCIAGITACVDRYRKPYHIAMITLNYTLTDLFLRDQACAVDEIHWPACVNRLL